MYFRYFTVFLNTQTEIFSTDLLFHQEWSWLIIDRKNASSIVQTNAGLKWTKGGQLPISTQCSCRQQWLPLIVPLYFLVLHVNGKGTLALNRAAVLRYPCRTDCYSTTTTRLWNSNSPCKPQQSNMLCYSSFILTEFV